MAQEKRWILLLSTPLLVNGKRMSLLTYLEKLIKKYHIEHIAIGNGTASRETEQMTCELIQRTPDVSYMIVNEAGASVYSASKLAADEFPQYDVNLRSAISIARQTAGSVGRACKNRPQSHWGRPIPT